MHVGKGKVAKGKSCCTGPRSLPWRTSLENFLLLLEWCWSHGAPPQSPVQQPTRLGRACVYNFFWLFIIKTKQDQAHPSHVHGQIWLGIFWLQQHSESHFLAHPVCVVKYLYWTAVHHKTPVVSRTCTLARFIIHKSNISAHIDRATVWISLLQRRSTRFHDRTFHRSVYYYHTQQTSNTYSQNQHFRGRRRIRRRRGMCGLGVRVAALKVSLSGATRLKFK